MIISRTPFRMSFFGGGTDYPVWFREHGGAVLATTIDKYCYITCRRLPPFFEHRTRIAYSRIELVNNHQEIEHPAVRGVLKYLNINDGLEIHHDGDLPARTGLGSSSSFTVGLLHTLYALQHIMPSKAQLAQAAIHVEQDVLGEAVGCQDQVLAAQGSLCRVNFFQNGEIGHTPIVIRPERLAAFQTISNSISQDFHGSLPRWRVSKSTGLNNARANSSPCCRWSKKVLPCSPAIAIWLSSEHYCMTPGC